MIPKPQYLFLQLTLETKVQTFSTCSTTQQNFHLPKTFFQGILSLGLPKPTIPMQSCQVKSAPQGEAKKNPSFLKRVYLPMLLVEVWYHPHTKPSNGGGSWWLVVKKISKGVFEKKGWCVRNFGNVLTMKMVILGKTWYRCKCICTVWCIVIFCFFFFFFLL